MIQGIEVPKGTHIIEFKFQPNIIYVSAVISVITLFILMIFLISYKNKGGKLKWS